MEAMRDAWTDDRLDDLAKRMDQGFDRVDRDVRELRAEMKSEFAEARADTKSELGESRAETKSEFTKLRREIDVRFEKVDERFDRVDRRFERIDDRLDSIQRTMALGAVTLTGSIIAGFAAMIGLIVAGY